MSTKRRARKRYKDSPPSRWRRHEARTTTSTICCSRPTLLAEGVNLQQCRNIINYDMPWNPMRLVQRHGRIDRIGSPHLRVFMRTIFPADQLDRLLKLEQRILNKLAMAAASVGVVAPIEGAAHGTQVFTETRGEIEKLLKEDASQSA